MLTKKAVHPGRLPALLCAWCLFASGMGTSLLEAAEPYTATFNTTSGLLTVKFGDLRDVVHFSYDFANNLIQLQQDPENSYSPGPYLLVNGGQTISRLAVKKWVIDLGGGDDVMIEPFANVPELWIYGGPGNDVIKTPAGIPVCYLYGGPGDDTINAEHSRANFLYGEEGNDMMWGSSDGPNYLDGGAGSNYLYTFFNTWDRTSVQTVVHRQGSNDSIFDSGSPTVYRFLPNLSTPSASGSFTIYEMTTQGTDTLDFSLWNRPVTVNLASTNPQAVSADSAGKTILTLQLALYASRVEKVLYPANRPPVANNQSVTLAEDTAKAVTLSATDPDSGPAALTYTVVAPPAHGSLSGSGPNRTYTPYANYNGTDSFTFKANDGAADSNLATVSLTVTPVNDPPALSSQPTAAPNPAKTGQAVAFAVGASDPDGEALTYLWNFGDGTNGPGAGPTHVYSVAGTYAVSVSVADGKGGTVSGSVTVVVTTADTSGPALNVASTILKGTVSDPSGVASLKVNGTAVAVNSDGTWQREVPLAAGTNSVTITATDGAGNSTTKVLSVTK